MGDGCYYNSTIVLHTGWSIRLYTTFRWHQNKSSFIVQPPYTKTQLSIRCQQNVDCNLMYHPVYFIEYNQTVPFIPLLAQFIIDAQYRAMCQNWWMGTCFISSLMYLFAISMIWEAIILSDCQSIASKQYFSFVWQFHYVYDFTEQLFIQSLRHNRFLMRLMHRNPENVALGILNGHNCLVSGTYKYSLGEYMSVFKQEPREAIQ